MKRSCFTSIRQVVRVGCWLNQIRALQIEAAAVASARERIDQAVADGGIVAKYLHPDTEKASGQGKADHSLSQHIITWTQGQ